MRSNRTQSIAEVLTVLKERVLRDRGWSVTRDRPAPPIPRCSICGDLGWTSLDVPVSDPRFGKLVRCECQSKSPSRHATRTWLPASIRHVSLVTYTFNHISADDQFLIERLQNFSGEPKGWLLFLGPTRCGKTHLAGGIANACLAAGHSVAFFDTVDLLDHLRPHGHLADTEGMAFLKKVDLLILDNLGMHNATGWATEKLYQILSARYQAQSPTVVTAEMNDFKKLDGRLLSRFADSRLVRAIQLKSPIGDPNEMAILRWINQLSDHAHQQFESFQWPSDETLRPNQVEGVRSARTMILEFATNPHGCLVLVGGEGVGKTHIAAAIANYRAKLGQTVLFATTSRIVSCLAQTLANESIPVTLEECLQTIRDVPLLVLDSLGDEKKSTWTREKLFQILDYRYLLKLPTVVTSISRVHEVDERIYKRLVMPDVAQIVVLDLPSRTRSKARLGYTAHEYKEWLPSSNDPTDEMEDLPDLPPEWN